MTQPILTPMLPANSLADKTIIITGGGTGLGKAMAAMLLTLGAKIVITSRKEGVLQQAAADLRQLAQAEVLPLACDVRVYEQVENMIQQTVAHFGSFNGLINNAAGYFISATERLSHRAFDTVVDFVLKGSYNCTLAAGKYWLANQISASVLSIVTTYAWSGSGWVVPSACGKAGVLALMQSLAVEWGRKGIRCNAIAPGPFPTEGAWSRLLPEPIAKMYNPDQNVPLGRMGQLAEIANLAAYLMSDYSAYVNGDCITIDGGEWLQGAGEFNHLRHLPAEMWDAIAKFVQQQRG